MSAIASLQPLLENEGACCRRVAQRESAPYTKERPEGSIPFPAYQPARHLNPRSTAPPIICTDAGGCRPPAAQMDARRVPL